MKRSFIHLCVPMLLLAIVAAPAASQPTSAAKPDTQRMDEAIRFYADNPPRFMGVVLVARGTDVLFVKGYGMANLEWSVPHTPTTRIPIGSNSKQFTAAAILLLEERGKLRVTDPIKSYLPDPQAAWDAITFHHLLSHTSGLLNSAPAERGTLALPARPDKTLERFRNMPLQFAPGTRFGYSNAGYQLLAYLIERTSGQRYEDFLRENIFEPLGMKDSDSGTHAPVIPSLASGYGRRPGGEQGSTAAFLNAPFIDLSNGMGAGSLYSTVGDLHRWTLGLFGGRLLRGDSLTKMTTPVIQLTGAQREMVDGGYAYGLIAGTSEGRRRFTHVGGVNGFVSYLVYYPASQVTVALLGNLPSGNPVEERRPPIVVVGDWLGTLAHGGTVTLPARR
jgi:CubicO group peptidase (beta-lactamase class C family)